MHRVSTLLAFLALACSVEDGRRPAPPGNYDLEVREVQVVPRRPQVGDGLHFSYTISNAGTDDIPADTLDVAVSVNGVLVGAARYSVSIPAGGSRTFSAFADEYAYEAMVVGGVEYEVVVDHLNRVPETDEKNNALKGHVEVVPRVGSVRRHGPGLVEWSCFGSAGPGGGQPYVESEPPPVLHAGSNVGWLVGLRQNRKSVSWDHTLWWRPLGDAQAGGDSRGIRLVGTERGKTTPTNGVICHSWTVQDDSPPGAYEVQVRIESEPVIKFTYRRDRPEGSPATAPQPQLPRVSLAWHPKTGRAFSVRVALREEYPDGRSPLVVLREKAILYHIVVMEPDGDGNVRLACTIDWVKCSLSSGPFQEAYDSAQGTPPQYGLFRGLPLLVNRWFTVRIDVRGRVLAGTSLGAVRELLQHAEGIADLSQDERAAAADYAADLMVGLGPEAFVSWLAQYPERPAAVGDSWSTTLGKRTTVRRLVACDNGVASIAVSHASSSCEGLFRWRGQCSVEIGSGLIIKGEFGLELNQAVLQGVPGDASSVLWQRRIAEGELELLP